MRYRPRHLRLNSRRQTLPRGIIGTLIIATILYVLVAIVLTGMVPFTKLDVADPVAFALERRASARSSAGIISVGALGWHVHHDGHHDLQLIPADLCDWP